MRKILFRLVLLIPILGFSQTEHFISTESDIADAIADFDQNYGGYGTISVTNDVSITVPQTIPSTVTLNFYTGNKLLINPNTNVTIRGTIKAATTQIFETSQLEHQIKIHNQKVYPEWFGLCSYQTSPETELADNIPIQKAVNSLFDGGELYIGGSKYFIHNPVEVDTPGIVIRGRGGYSNTNVDTGDFFYANDLILKDDVVPSIFNINQAGIQVSYLNFRKKAPDEGLTKEEKKKRADEIERKKKGGEATGIALNFVRSDGRKDQDAFVNNCRFNRFKNCIFARGNNLKITDNTFSSSYIGINIKNATKDIGDHTYHTRGYIIDRNRFHSLTSSLIHSSIEGSSCIKISPERRPSLKSYEWEGPETPPADSFTIDAHYNHITNNYADDCKTFFEGSVDRTKISGNSILRSMGTAIKAFSGQFGEINNNLIDGSVSYNIKAVHNSANGLRAKISYPSGHGIHVKYSHFLTINNNQIFNKRFHGIYIERSKNSSIQSNTIRGFNRHSLTLRCRVDETTGVKKTICSKIIDNDPREYDGIHIAKVQDDDLATNDKYNIQNIISNNTISMPYTTAKARYGIYAGDGDDYNYIKNNFIVSTRLIQPIKIE